jgi:predicted metal-dependent hydrolase
MTDSIQMPTIVAFVADLYFSSRIASAAEGLHFRVEWVERAEQLGLPEQGPAGRRFGEHLSGPSGELIRRLSQWQPALLVFDLNNAAIPWREWIELLTTVPATRRIPVLCFGSHREVQALAAARKAGAKAVLARARFVAELPHLLQKYARLPDRAGLERACGDELSASARRGLEAFNRGDFFEAHELLEAAWLEDDSPGRDLYQGMVQLAVAYHHIRRGNFNGAMKMFLRLRQWLEPLPARCRGVEVARLREQADQAQAALQALGEQRIGEFDLSLLQPISYRA